MAKDAYYFLVPLLILASLSFYLHVYVLAGILLGLAGFVAFFFRDPNRLAPADPETVVSPADGKLVIVDRDEKGTRLSIFLSVFDVHINRAPIAGTVTRQEYHPGKYRVAWDERASVENERLFWTIKGDREVNFALIAGIVARRICPWKKEGDRLQKGDKIGLIRFGSRVDMVLPPEFEVVVKKGDRVRGGASVLGYWRDNQ